ncbi:hypothetical protein KI387_042849 [Taxus chinensis]|uniref:Uncharacterized protein n=1 Tax=Taxus chinensis TaxID=29808 RepID=A0AA38C3A3_TAXCH|nr:hypothetical protein KI387_042849 [Taxus chinensis]
MDKAEEIPSSLSLSYSEGIRPLLDVVDKLQNLNVMNEGIQLPYIVVVGDQSSGKSSVLECLTGISLPRGVGICTRVPLIMRLQNSSEQDSEIVVEYNDTVEHIIESQITERIDSITKEIAGTNKGISHVPIRLNVKKMNAPDLTLVDLPGIARVSLNGNPDDHELISKIVMEYISPADSIILNVLSATVNFRTCESIRMSQRVDVHGERTLGVVTKVDIAPEGLLEKVALDDVNTGLGYVCVRNRVGDECNEEAREAEAELFRSHTQLNKFDEAMVGIPMLARRLMQIQTKRISKCFPDIVKNIEDTLSQRQSELSSLPQQVSNPMEAMVVFLRLMNGVKDCLNRLLIEGDFSEFSEETEMHCTARLKEMFDGFYNELVHMSVEDKNAFLVEETKRLEESKGAGLSNFLSRSIFKKRIDEVLKTGLSLTANVWDYVEKVVLRVLDLKFRSYPRLETATKKDFQLLVSKRREQCIHHVNQVAEMEKSLDFTLNPVYMETWTDLLKQKDQFMQELSKTAEEPVTAPQFNIQTSQPVTQQKSPFGVSTAPAKPVTQQKSSSLFKSTSGISTTPAKPVTQQELPSPLESLFHISTMPVKPVTQQKLSSLFESTSGISTTPAKPVTQQTLPSPFESPFGISTTPAKPVTQQKTPLPFEQTFGLSSFSFSATPAEPITRPKSPKGFTAKPAAVFSGTWMKKTVNIKGFGEVDVEEVMKMPKEHLEVAFEMKARVVSYWKVVVQRVGDGIPMYLQFVYQNLVRNDIDEEIMKKVAGPKSNSMEKLLEENSMISRKRRSLKRSIDSLGEAQCKILEIMDQIAEI